jgi:hypothetical protein
MVYAEAYKECEATSTGAMRKSSLISSANGMVDSTNSLRLFGQDASGEPESPNVNTFRVVLRTANGVKPSSQWPPPTEAPKHTCSSCGVTSSPIWWSVHDTLNKKMASNSGAEMNGVDGDIKMEDQGSASLYMESENHDTKLCHRCYFVA